MASINYLDEVNAITSAMSKRSFSEVAIWLKKLKTITDELIKFSYAYMDYQHDFICFQDEYEELLTTLCIDEDDSVTEKIRKPCYVYYLLNAEKDKVKIGVSNDPLQRAKILQTACGEELEILSAIKFKSKNDALMAESFLHRKYGKARCKVSKTTRSVEWFHSDIVADLLSNYGTKEGIEKGMEKQLQVSKIVANSYEKRFFRKEETI